MSGETFLFSENQHLLWPVGSRSWTGVPAGKMAEIPGFGGVFFNEWSKYAGGGRSGERKTQANH